MRPHAIAGESSRAITNFFIARNLHLPRGRLNGALQCALHIRVAGSHCGCRQFTNNPIVTIGCDDYLAGARPASRGAVFEDAGRSEKDEGQDHRDHDVIVNPPSGMGPQNVAPDGLSYAHRAICLRSSLEAHLQLCNLAQENKPTAWTWWTLWTRWTSVHKVHALHNVHGNLAFSAVASKITPSASQMQEQALSTRGGGALEEI